MKSVTGGLIPGVRRDPAAAALIVFFLAAVFLLSFIRLEDTDAWTHLSFGRLIWETKSIPATEPFIVTSQPYPYNNWLFGLIFYLVYAVGSFAGVITLKALIVTTACAFLLADSLRPKANPFISVVVLCGALIILRGRVAERPDIMLFLFLSCSIFCLNAYLSEGRRYLFGLPFLHLLWGNMHTSVPLMVVPFLAVLMGGLLDRVTGRSSAGFSLDKRQARTVLAIFLLSFVFSLISPYFFGQYTHSAQAVSSRWWSQEIMELQPPSWGQFGWPYLIIIILGISSLLNYRRISWVHIFLVLPFIVLALKAIRFTYPLAVVAAPVIARNLTDLARVSGNAQFFQGRVGFVAAAAAIVVVLALCLVPGAPFYTPVKAFGASVNLLQYPEGALKFMDRNSIDGKVFNTFHWGGYITWRDRSRHAFIDGRGFLDESLLEKTGAATHNPNILDELERRYGFEAVLLQYPVLDEQTLAKVQNTDVGLMHPGWRLVYWDDACLLYLKAGGRFDAVVSRDAYRYIRPASGFRLSAETLADKAQVAALAAELERNRQETGSLSGRLFLGVLYNATGRFAEASVLLSELLPGASGRPAVKGNALKGLAIAQEGLGNLAAAVSFYQRSLREVSDPDVLLRLGTIAINRGEDREAVTYLRKALEKNPAQPRVHAQLATAYRRLGMTTEADASERVYRESAAMSTGEASFRKATEAYLAGRLDDALAGYAASLAQNPLNPATHSNIGYIYFDQGDFARSEAEQRRALELDSSYASAHYGLALVSLKRANPEEARRHFQEYLRLEPKGYYARMAEAELGKLPVR